MKSCRTPCSERQRVSRSGHRMVLCGTDSARLERSKTVRKHRRSYERISKCNLSEGIAAGIKTKSRKRYKRLGREHLCSRMCVASSVSRDVGFSFVGDLWAVRACPAYTGTRVPGNCKASPKSDRELNLSAIRE